MEDPEQPGLPVPVAEERDPCFETSQKWIMPFIVLFGIGFVVGFIGIWWCWAGKIPVCDNQNYSFPVMYQKAVEPGDDDLYRCCPTSSLCNGAEPRDGVGQTPRYVRRNCREMDTLMLTTCILGITGTYLAATLACIMDRRNIREKCRSGRCLELCRMPQ